MTNDPLARLQGADPAGPDPDLGDLAARVLADSQAYGAAQENAAADGALRSRRLWLLPVAAGITAIALAGAALAGYSAGRDGATIVASPPIAVEAVAPESQMAADASAPEAMTIAPDESAKTMLASPTIWRAAGSVPDSPSVGTGYRVVPGDVDPRALTFALAEALGIDGPVTDAEGGWQAGNADGSNGPSLWVNDDALISWSFFDPAPVTGTTPMDPAEATTAARGFLRDIGVPVREVEWQVMQIDGTTTVTAWHLMGGVRSQLQWTVTLAPDGRIVGATGFAAAFEPIPGYELVGAATAIDRISDPGWPALAPSAITPGQEAAARPSQPSDDGITPLMNGRPTLTVPVQSVTLTGSTIGLASYPQSDGSMLLLPSYLVSDDTGATWSLIAVADRYVRFDES